MNIMDRMIERWLKNQSPQQKREMMAKMMPRMMEGMGAEDMMATMSPMMPRMMENCLTPMSEEERRKMLSFCRTMLGDMEERFGVATEKGRAR